MLARPQIVQGGSCGDERPNGESKDHVGPWPEGNCDHPGATRSPQSRPREGRRPTVAHVAAPSSRLRDITLTRAPRPQNASPNPATIAARFTYHPSFAPPSSDVPIWRYIDMPKLVALLETEALFFARLDTQPDRFEGSLLRSDIGDGALDELGSHPTALATCVRPSHSFVRGRSLAAGTSVSTSRRQCGTCMRKEAAASQFALPRDG